MCLDEVRRGQRVCVTSIDDDFLRTQLLRFGIAEGSPLVCLERIPLGPLLVKHCRQEIAIGREAAKQIVVAAEESR